MPKGWARFFLCRFGRLVALERCTRAEETLAHASSARQQQPAIWAQDFELEVLSEDLALLIYRSAQITSSGELQRHTNRSSLWQWVEGSWKMRFHQGTATQPLERRAT